ncbi:pyridoxal phosphate-dependent aminotransferase [Acetobacter oeni]|uniref:Aminotransferase n=1 Tax=Acetobacter oeni TaxID=304077 RepID=A0A511XIF5_9PROT|nr:pyridoxal phosphate-dependent aminotransferase [Acetobacter oeni]MBB3881458.1 histidinol-phosphate aminotransferase [Acetobacter oeni]NHO18323.1 aminotransferase class I/II-fold pyridoxal phosphate-dependent enzyme [Acetobacter oeni]GBR10927.1 aminotransferase [Acetobacter oeni LMG 21952]GEN62735.1 aminotransferase [Acetobacter oeni]
MTSMISKEGREELLARGYSRRQFGRIAALLGMPVAAAATLPKFMSTGRAATTTDIPEMSRPDKRNMVRIGTNECWTGPFPSAAVAGAATVKLGNRYEPGDLRSQLITNASKVEALPESHILPWPGSSDPLSRVVVTFCSPGRGLVTADPTFEASWRTAAWLNVKCTKVPLRPENNYATDVKAMLAADPNAGVYYVCSPNNPTGTLTPVADIAWLVANKPAGSIVLVDEAYLHFSEAKSAAYLVAQNQDVIVLRTFSKLFGMAGLRLGFSFAKPELHAKMMRYDGKNQSGTLSIVAVAVGSSSLLQAQNIVRRRNEMIAAREATFAHLRQRGITYIPSDANMFIVDWKKPAGPVKAAFAEQGIDIGRNWPVWPNASRITVGSAGEMERFCGALDRVIV